MNFWFNSRKSCEDVVVVVIVALFIPILAFILALLLALVLGLAFRIHSGCGQHFDHVVDNLPFFLCFLRFSFRWSIPWWTSASHCVDHSLCFSNKTNIS